MVNGKLLMSWSVIGKVLGVLGVLVLVGCGGVPGALDEVTPTAERVVIPTVTALPRVTPTAGLSQAELEEVWRLPIVVSGLNYGICVEGQRVLAALAAGEMERPEVRGRLEALDLLIQVVDESLAGWVAADGVEERLKRLLADDTMAIQASLNGWLVGDVEDAAAEEAFAMACEAANGSGEQISEDAVIAGLSVLGVRNLLDEALLTLASAIAAEGGE